MSNTYLHPITGLTVANYSNQYSASYPASAVLDGSTSTYWRTDSPTGAYVTLQLSLAKAVTKLRIYVGSVSYYATSWTLSGSNDGASFTNLLTAACTSTIGWQEFTVSNTTEYLFYRWTCNTSSSARLYTYLLDFWESKAFVKADGKYVGLSFDEFLIGDPTGELPTPVGGWGISDNEITPAAVTTSGDYSASYPAANLIDGNTSTYWRAPSGGTVGSYIKLQFSEAIILGGFSYYQSSSYYPTGFTLHGSNDGENWTTLGSATNSEITAGWKTMSFDNGASYPYYKITITSGSSTSTLYIYELKTYLAKRIGNESAFTVSGQVYNGAIDGALETGTFTVVDVTMHPEVDNALLLEIKSNNRFVSVVGDLTVAYNKSLGNLVGYGGPVESFEISFAPEDLLWKGDQNNREHIEISNITAEGNLIHIYYSDYQAGDEHLEITNISAVGVLTHIDDI